MAITETGHAKILVNFDQLIKSVSGLGSVYSPSKKELTLEGLQQTAKTAKEAMEAAAKAVLTYRSTVKRRETAFDPISKLATRIFNTLKVYDKTEKKDEIAKLYLRKIHGRRLREKRTDDEKKIDLEAGIQYKEISASQMSYDQRLENLSMLINLAASSPSYTPNEKELQSESLKALLNELQKLNEAVRVATSDLFKARARRNEILYKEASGLVDIALDTKTYLKGAFGTSSDQYKEVASISFKRFNRN
jgi:Flp pilus assembly protein TadG